MLGWALLAEPSSAWPGPYFFGRASPAPLILAARSRQRGS